MLFVGPDCPAALQPLMRSVVDAIIDLQQPGKPVRLGEVAAAANLPTASDWPNCHIIVTTINAVAVSTLTGSTWAWTRSDGTAL